MGEDDDQHGAQYRHQRIEAGEGRAAVETDHGVTDQKNAQ